MKCDGRVVAIKISKAERSETDNAEIEAKLLRRIARKEPAKHNLIEVFDSFMFRHHFCIVTELCDINLYSYITQHK